MKGKNNLIPIVYFLLSVSLAVAQQQTIDKIGAVVGNNIILQSALESQYQQMLGRGEEVNEHTKCRLMEELLFQKLLYVYAQKDSTIKITDSQVDGEIDRRMRYFMAYFGSEEKFKEFYGKTSEQFKNDVRDDVKEFLMAKAVNDKITGDITVSPAEIKSYFENIPADSIPFINSEVEIGQIIRKAPVSMEAKKEARKATEELRERILKSMGTSGESNFASLAILYSEDPGSAKNGGKYENIPRGQFAPEFDAIAFRLKEGEISEVFETTFGFHVMQLLKKKGEFVDLRHILITPKVTNSDLQKAREVLDSIYTALQKDSVSFADLAGKYSDDEETKINGGLLMNPVKGSSRFTIEELGQYDPSLVFAIDKMKTGEVSRPVLTMTRDARQAYKIIYLKSRTEPHRANLKEDYQLIQNMVQAEKQQKTIKDWVQKKLSSVYIRLDDEYKNCKFENNWVRFSN